MWSQVRRLVPAAVIALAALVNLLTPPSVSSAALLAVAPVTAVSLLSPVGIVGIGLTAMMVQGGWRSPAEATTGRATRLSRSPWRLSPCWRSA